MTCGTVRHCVTNSRPCGLHHSHAGFGEVVPGATSTGRAGASCGAVAGIFVGQAAAGEGDGMAGVEAENVGVIADGAFEVAELPARMAPMQQGADVLRIDLENAVEIADRFLGFVDIDEDLAALLERFDIIAVEIDGGGEIVEGGINVVKMKRRCGPNAMRHRLSVAHGEHGTGIDLGVLQIADLLINHRSAQKRGDSGGGKVDGDLVIRQGAARLALKAVRVAAPGIQIRPSRIEFQAAREVKNRLFVVGVLHAFDAALELEFDVVPLRNNGRGALGSIEQNRPFGLVLAQKFGDRFEIAARQSDAAIEVAAVGAREGMQRLEFEVRERMLDQAAAIVILEDWLSGERMIGGEKGEEDRVVMSRQR